MRVKLVFDDWRDANNRSIYQTPTGIELSLGDFHSGTMFDAEILLSTEVAEELQAALSAGHTPHFYAVKWKEHPQ